MFKQILVSVTDSTFPGVSYALLTNLTKHNGELHNVIHPSGRARGILPACGPLRHRKNM